MIWLGLLSLWAMANSECVPSADADTLQTVLNPDGEHANVLLEVWWATHPTEQSAALVSQLNTLQIPHIVVLPADAQPNFTSEGRPSVFLTHQALAIHVPDSETWPEQPYAFLNELKQLRKMLKKEHRVQTVALIGDFPNVRTEATALKAGFNILLPTQTADVRAPRLAAFFPNQVKMGSLIPSNEPYRNCGIIQEWQPHHGPRFTKAILSNPQDVVRIPVHSELRSPRVFLTWLNTVGLTGDHRPIPLATLGTAQWRRSIQRPKATASPLNESTTQRIVSQQVILDIAKQLQHTTDLPRTLAHGLNLTEAFAALSTALSQERDAPVHIGSLLPPQHLAVSQLSEKQTFELSTVELLNYLDEWSRLPNTHVPSSVRLGETTVSAAELLVLMSQAVLQRPTLSVSLVRVPDPRASGLGWGQSNL